MSYRPPEQELEGPCDKIIEGIRDFTGATFKRIESDDWTEKHKEEITGLMFDLIDIQVRLTNFKKNNW